ncbi:MAG: hypothetical protein HY548_04955 [Elusimicrobia bacterium]|nr:hypothetical protein [Elusimicrobiota bacterium]
MKAAAQSAASFLFFTALIFSPSFAVYAQNPVETPPAQAPGWEKRPIRIPPLLWYEKDPEIQRRFLMVSMLYWDYKEKETGHQLLLPLFYRWRQADRRLLISLPLVASYRRPSEMWTLAGPFFRHADEDKTQTALFPLYWQRSRPEGGQVTTALPFLFYDYRSRHREKIDQVNLLGWFRRRPSRFTGMQLNYWWSEEPEARFRALFPIYWHLWSPGDRLDVLVPFYYRRQEPENEPSTLFDAPVRAARVRAGLFPLVGAGWGTEYRSHYVLPLYYYSRSPDQRAFATIPASSFRSADLTKGHLGLYFFSHDPDLRVDGVFPLWYRRRAADGFERRLQVLNFYERLENEDYFQTTFPLYGYWSSPRGSRFLSWGVWRQSSPETSSGWAYLYRWKRTAEGDSTRVFFPLYWHFWRAPDWGVDIFFPVYGRYRDGSTTVTAVPPVIVRKSPEKRTVSLLFLYWRDREVDRGSVTFLPLFHYNYNPARRMFFSPVAWTRRSASSREGIVPPVYWYRSNESRRFFAFPLYWGIRTPDKDLTIVPPYYRWRREDLLARGIFPVFGRHSSTTERGSYLFPFYWYSGTPRGDGLWIIPPILGFVSKRGTGTENPRLFAQYLLLGNVQKSTDTLSHDFFPLYKYIREKDFKNFWAPRGIALTAWEKRGDLRKGYVFPYLWRRSPPVDWDLVLPLFYKSRQYEVLGGTETVRERVRRKGGATTFFPLYWSGANPERRYRFFFPLYAHYGEEDRRFSAFTPLWVSYDSPQKEKFRMFFPLFWRFLMKAEPSEGKPQEEAAVLERDIVVFGPWYRVDTLREQRKSRTIGLAPFYSNTYTGPQDKYFEILGGLFARDVQEGRRRFRFLYFFYTRPR